LLFVKNFFIIILFVSLFIPNFWTQKNPKSTKSRRKDSKNFRNYGIFLTFLFF